MAAIGVVFAASELLIFMSIVAVIVAALLIGLTLLLIASCEFTFRMLYAGGRPRLEDKFHAFRREFSASAQLRS